MEIGLLIRFYFLNKFIGLLENHFSSLTASRVEQIFRAQLPNFELALEQLNTEDERARLEQVRKHIFIVVTSLLLSSNEGKLDRNICSHYSL